MEYLTLDQDCNILEASLGARRFADCPSKVVKGKKVYEGFPELIGLEDTLIAIFQGRQASFELKGIGHFPEQEVPRYINLYILNNQDKGNSESRLIILLEDVTEKMVLEQKLVQMTNEVGLLLEAWSYCSNYLNKIIKFIADALIVTTSSGIIKIVNRASEQFFEYSQEELVGKPIAIILSEGSSLLEISQKHLLAQDVLNDVKVICKTKTGTQIAIAFSCSAIQSDIKDLQDFIYIGRKLTEGGAKPTSFKGREG